METMERLYLVELCAPVLVFAILTSVGCIDSGKVVRNSQGDFVPAALDLRSCEVLAMKQFHLPSAEISAAYDAALQGREIIQLANDTNMVDVQVLNFESNRLVPWTPLGPMTVAEEIRRHIGVYEWMSPKEGPYKGRKVCVSTSMIYGKVPVVP